MTGPRSTGDQVRPARLPGFVALLLWAMAIATFGVFAVGILASYLIDDLGLTRADIGTIAAVNLFAGALLSPAAGTFSDRLGGARAMAMLFVFGALSFLLMGVAAGFATLVVASLIGGLSQALGNPATNKSIAVHIAPGRRGWVTGLKQSGVQLGIFLGGATFPALTEAFGWRATLIGTGVLAAAAVPLVFVTLPGDGTPSEGTVRGDPPVPPVVWWIAAYGFLLGASVAATVFIPLFAEEQLGTSTRVGGAAVAVIGVVAVIGRIVWARWAERTHRHRAALSAIALASVAGSGVMLLAAPDAVGWLWVGVVVIGLSSSSWNSVGMLAVIDLTPQDAAGRASGRVLLGFLLGFALGPRVYGEIVDRTASYDEMWFISMMLALITLGVTVAWRRAVTDERPRR